MDKDCISPWRCPYRGQLVSWRVVFWWKIYKYSNHTLTFGNWVVNSHFNLNVFWLYLVACLDILGIKITRHFHIVCNLIFTMRNYTVDSSMHNFNWRSAFPYKKNEFTHLFNKHLLRDWDQLFKNGSHSVKYKCVFLHWSLNLKLLSLWIGDRHKDKWRLPWPSIQEFVGNEASQVPIVTFENLTNGKPASQRDFGLKFLGVIKRFTAPAQEFLTPYGINSHSPYYWMISS